MKTARQPVGTKNPKLFASNCLVETSTTGMKRCLLDTNGKRVPIDSSNWTKVASASNWQKVIRYKRNHGGHIAIKFPFPIPAVPSNEALNRVLGVPEVLAVIEP
tara:strand:- start:528 stop:839 length:312 start_codon:yes stop_codon:yes gene_type:complete